jgi:hypothetical protein
MGSKALANRGNWQEQARKTGDYGEGYVFNMLNSKLPEKYKVELSPKKIPIYKDGKGIKLDLKVTNTEINQCIFVEVKTGKQGGNATEERASKFLSSGIKRKVKSLYETPENPFLMLFTGRIFEGDESFICEWVEKKTGKTKTKWIDPELYREKVETLFEGENYGFITEEAQTHDAVINKVLEIL